MKNLYAIFTMDCESIRGYGTEGGPPGWEFSKKAITGYCELLLKEGLSPTLFTVPYTAENQSKILLDLEKEGVEPALHYHPQDHGFNDFLGAYNRKRQIEMLKEAKKQWSDAIGKNPVSFRPGNFSANDHTFPVLEKLGLKQGSVSCPDRNFTMARSNWKGASLYPHYAHSANRLIEDGDMDFLEVPVTADNECVMWGGLTPLELRVEMVNTKDHGYTIRKAIDKQMKLGIKMPVLVVITHNIFDYSDPEEHSTKVLQSMVDEMKRYSEIKGLNLKGPTLNEYHRIFNEYHKGK